MICSWSVQLDEQTKELCLVGELKPKCPYCKTDMKFQFAKALHFSLTLKEDDRNAYAVDIEIECPYCYYWEVFGVAIKKEIYEFIAEHKLLICATQDLERLEIE